MWFVWRKIRYDIRNMTSRHTIPDFPPNSWIKIRLGLEENPVCFGEKFGMVGKCDFMAFRVDLRLQSPRIIIFRNRACVRTTEQSRTVEYTRPDFWKKSGISGEQSGRKCSLEKNPVCLEKNPVFLKKTSVSILMLLLCPTWICCVHVWKARKRDQRSLFVNRPEAWGVGLC
jgi:hypothetical protein